MFKILSLAISGIQPHFQTLVPLSTENITSSGYYDAVKAFSVHAFQAVHSLFLSHFGAADTLPFCIVMTGSDGRQEKSQLSNVELIVVFASGIEHAEKEHFQTAIGAIIKANPNLFDPVADYVSLGRDNVFLFNQEPQLVFPTRNLDSRLVFGSASVFHEYSVDEPFKALQQSKSSLNVSEKVRKRAAQYKSILEHNGKQTFHHEDIQHYRLDTTELTLYFDKPKGLYSTKNSHLRVMQYYLARDVVKAMETGQLTAEDIQMMPKNTIERLHYLRLKGLYKKDVNDLAGAYKQALYFYHESEEHFQKTGETSLTLRGNEVEAFKRMEEAICKFFGFKKEADPLGQLSLQRARTF